MIFLMDPGSANPLSAGSSIGLSHCSQTGALFANDFCTTTKYVCAGCFINSLHHLKTLKNLPPCTEYMICSGWLVLSVCSSLHMHCTSRDHPSVVRFYRLHPHCSQQVSAIMEEFVHRQGGISHIGVLHDL